jgi:hypothetical protein
MKRADPETAAAPWITILGTPSRRTFDGTLAIPGICLRDTSAGFAAMREIKPDQLWEEGLHQVRVINVFGVRVVIRREGHDTEEEIAEDDFRARFKFVADR